MTAKYKHLFQIHLAEMGLNNIPPQCNPCPINDRELFKIRMLRLQGFLDGLVAAGNKTQEEIFPLYEKISEAYFRV